VVGKKQETSKEAANPTLASVGKEMAQPRFEKVISQRLVAVLPIAKRLEGHSLATPITDRGGVGANPQLGQLNDLRNDSTCGKERE
jgi:hypothetical protein